MIILVHLLDLLISARCVLPNILKNYTITIIQIQITRVRKLFRLSTSQLHFLKSAITPAQVPPETLAPPPEPPPHNGYMTPPAPDRAASIILRGLPPGRM
jgi:hypothetical protein